jgi:hypothetical protein
MAGAALIVELLFTALGLVPRQRQARVVEASVTWNYTTWLNLVLPRPGGLSALAFRPHRRPAHAAHNEPALWRPARRSSIGMRSRLSSDVAQA